MVDIQRLKEREREEEAANHNSRARQRKKMSSPEMWETQQLINSGVLRVTEYPTFDGDSGAGMMQDVEVEEELEIELNEDEPAFLQGQTRMSRDFSPVRIVKNPDGSLQRAALHQSQLSKERRELKQAQVRASRRDGVVGCTCYSNQ